MDNEIDEIRSREPKGGIQRCILYRLALKGLWLKMSERSWWCAGAQLHTAHHVGAERSFPKIYARCLTSAKIDQQTPRDRK